MNKKGISPLVSTVILIILAAGIGVIVMNWGRAQLEEGSKCAIDTQLKIVELNNYPQICYSGQGENGFIKFIAENGAATDISSIQLRVIGSKEIYLIEVPDSYVEKGYTVQKIVPYNFNIFGKVKNVKITPKIVVYPNDPPLFCAEQALVFEDLKEC